MLKRGKAAGHDNITGEMLKNLGENGLKILTKLDNKIREEERIPKHWEVGIVISLFKKGDINNTVKHDKDNNNNITHNNVANSNCFIYWCLK